MCADSQRQKSHFWPSKKKKKRLIEESLLDFREYVF